jgi:preprotein translocase subunit SecB
MRKKAPIKADSTNYETFLRNLSLFDICLIRSSSEVQWKPYRELLNRKTNAPGRFDVSYELSDVGDGFFNTTSTFQLTVPGHKAGKSVLTIECVFRGHFHVQGKAVRELAQRFTDSELELVVWPYFRQFVSDTTARMSIPPITLPLSTEV